MKNFCQQAIAERVAIVALAAPLDWDSDQLWDYLTGDWRFNPLPSAAAREAMGYLDGIAEFADVLISDLIDEMGIDLAGTLTLVRSRKRRALPGARSARVAASKDKS